MRPLPQEVLKVGKVATDNKPATALLNIVIRRPNGKEPEDKLEIFSYLCQNRIEADRVFKLRHKVWSDIIVWHGVVFNEQ
jgi:hypothetical protein